MNIRSPGFAFAAAALAAALSGCSSGGGTPAVPGSPQTPTVAVPLDSEIGRRAVQGSRPATAAAAAESEPRAGSVTQSSNTESGSNTTADQVQVEFNNAGTYTVRNTRQGARWTVSTQNAVSLPRDLVGPDATAIGMVVQEEGGNRFLIAQTREPTNAGNTDWLTAGIWAFVPSDGESVDRYEFGAFADGGDLFDQDDLQALTGTATYDGRAFGVYYSISSDGTSDAGPFGGAVSLTADFGDDGALGTISGSVTGVVTQDGPIAGVTLALGEASIGDASGGFFTGATSMTLGGRAYAGRWGGQFFDDGAAGAAPGSVAGTFGAGIRESDDQAAALVGAFVADR